MTKFLEDRKLIRSAGRFFDKLDYNLLIIRNIRDHKIASGNPVKKEVFAPKLSPLGKMGWFLYVAPKGKIFSIERLDDLSDRLAWHWFGRCKCNGRIANFF